MSAIDDDLFEADEVETDVETDVEADEVEAEDDDFADGDDEAEPQAETVQVEQAAQQVQPTQSAAEVEPDAEELKATVDAFEAAIKSVLKDTDGRDLTSGHLSVELVGKVRAAFVAIPNTGKTGKKSRVAAKKFLDDKMREALMAGATADARSYFQLHTEATAIRGGGAGGTATVKPTVDPVEQFIDRVTAMYLAPSLAGADAPKDLPADWDQRVQQKAQALEDQVASYLDWVAAVKAVPEGTADEDLPKMPDGISTTVLSAAAIARGRATGRGRPRKAIEGKADKAGTPRAPRPTGGQRGDIGKHVVNAFAQVSSGTFLTVAQIVKTPSSEYPGSAPSPGAVAARLKPASGNPCTIPGITVGTNDSGRLGATKN